MSEHEIDDLLSAMVCMDGRSTMLSYTVKEKEDALTLIEKLERFANKRRT